MYSCQIAVVLLYYNHVYESLSHPLTRTNAVCSHICICSATLKDSFFPIFKKSKIYLMLVLSELALKIFGWPSLLSVIISHCQFIFSLCAVAWHPRAINCFRSTYSVLPPVHATFEFIPNTLYCLWCLTPDGRKLISLQLHSWHKFIHW